MTLKYLISHGKKHQALKLQVIDLKIRQTILSEWHTSTKLYFSKSQSSGKMPIESFTGIRYFNIILHSSEQKCEWYNAYQIS